MFKNSSTERDVLNKRKSAKGLALALSVTLLLPALAPLLSEAKSSEAKNKKDSGDQTSKKADARADKKSKAEKTTKSKEAAQAELSQADQPQSVIGLPAAIERYINQGRWREASQLLEARVKKEKNVNRDDA